MAEYNRHARRQLYTFLVIGASMGHNGTLVWGLLLISHGHGLHLSDLQDWRYG